MTRFFAPKSPGRLVRSLFVLGWLLVYEATAAPSAVAQTPDFHTWIRRVAFSPDGRRAVVVENEKFAVMDVESGKKERCFTGHQFRVYAAAFSTDGKRIITGDGADLRIWDVRSGKLLKQFSGRNGNLSSLAFSPDGQFAVSGHSNGSGVRVLGSPPRDMFLWDLKIGEIVAHNALRPEVLLTQALFLAPFRALPEQWQDRVSVETYYRLHAPIYSECTRFEEQKHVNAIAFSRDGRRAICGRDDGTARILDVSSDREELVVRGHKKDVWSAVISPDGRTALTTGEDGTVRIWSLPYAFTRVLRAEEKHRLMGHEGAVYSAAFSKDGRRAVSGGADGTVRVWDLTTGKEAACFRAKDEITSVTFVADENMVTGGTWAWTVHTWKLPK